MNRNDFNIIKLLSMILTIAFIVSAAINPALAGDEPDELLNYSFGVWVGSGFYKVKSADKRFAVLRIPAAYTFREAQCDNERFIDRLGFRLLIPAVLAVQDETDTNFIFGAAAFVPGLEVQVPVNEYWTLQPFGQFGAGKDTAGGDLTYIYGGGARSLISFPWKKFNFGIGNSVIFAKDKDANNGDTNGFSMLEAGLDVTHPIGFTFQDYELEAGLFFVFSRFFNRVDFLEDGGDTERVNRIYTAGLTLGTRESVSIWKFSVDRVGIDYRWGNSGFRGIGFNLGFPF